MQNIGLVQDHLQRSKSRVAAIETLFSLSNWPDVVRESQEVVELLLKALLRSANVAPPRVHDVSAVLASERDRLPKDIQPKVDELADISRQLRRDRELAFYGSEDLTPSEFYRREDAERALSQAKWVLEIVSTAIDRCYAPR